MIIEPAATITEQITGNSSRTARAAARPPWLRAKRQPATPIRNLRLAPSRLFDSKNANSARILAACNYLPVIPKNAFRPCIPTRGTEVPAGPDWIHEIKHASGLQQRAGSVQLSRTPPHGSAACEATDPRAIPAHHQPIAVVFDFVNPQWAGRWPGRLRRLARCDEDHDLDARHGPHRAPPMSQPLWIAPSLQPPPAHLLDQRLETGEERRRAARACRRCAAPPARCRFVAIRALIRLLRLSAPRPSSARSENAM